MSQQQTDILKVLVGSRAHGLNNEDSDYDYRGVFIVPTKYHFEIGSKIKTTDWIEGKEDNTSWEIGHFLQMATQCNPTILEALSGRNLLELDDLDHDPEVLFAGKRLKALFPYVWNSKRVYDAFGGYAHNQQKKFMDEKDNRPWKFAVAWLRTLWQGRVLLEHGRIPLYVSSKRFREDLIAIKVGQCSRGWVVDKAHVLRKNLDDAYKRNPDKKTDLEVVNKFLVDIRRQFWSL